MRPGYPPASAGEPITQVTCSLENGITCVQSAEQVTLDPQLAVEFEKKEKARKLAIARKAAQQRILTVTSGTQYGTVTLLYVDYRSKWGSCVPFAKEQTGIYRTIGNGARAGIQGYEPRVGAIAAIKGVIHAGVVTAINGDYVTFKESGYKKGWITQRSLHKSWFIGYIYY